MKFESLIVSALLCGFTVLSCTPKIKENNTPAKDSTTTNSSTSSNQSTMQRTERVTISFYSVAYGIDYATKEAIDQFVPEFERKNGVTLPVQKVNWGREGEIDYCYDLRNISQNISTGFLTQVREITGNGKNIHIKVNELCREPRQ